MNQLTLYHCNDKKRCEQFLKNEIDLIESKEDGSWLGNGMYFWENLANAKYWLEQKKNKNDRQQYRILKCLVCLDCCLDLTDKDIIDEVYETWKEACRSVFHYKDDSSTNELGVIINQLFSDGFKDDFSSQYDIIKVLGKYVAEHVIFKNNKKQNKNLNKIRPTNAVKVIYCAKKKSCILSREVIKNG